MPAGASGDGVGPAADPEARGPLRSAKHPRTEAPAAGLPPGHRIAEYEIARVLGAGGFGITCLVFDHQLDGPVAIKEYFPADVATRGDAWRVSATAPAGRDVFAWGLERFLDEVCTIHRLRHPNVVRTHRCLEATARPASSWSTSRPNPRSPFRAGAAA